LQTGRVEGNEEMKYLVVVEKAGKNYSAYVPDLPGCVATGVTVEDTQRNIREAIAMHIEGMREDSLPIPEPQAQAAFVET
jgi:predicted RNase H-like HicB family nuclease